MRLFERIGVLLVFFGFVFVGAMTFSQYTQYAVSSVNDAGTLSGIGWMVVGLGMLLRFYPRHEELDGPSLAEP